MKRSHGLLGWLGWLGLAVSGLVFAGTPEVYQQHCAACHGADRLGGMGPALLPENLERLRKAEALKTVREGRAATQMQGEQHAQLKFRGHVRCEWPESVFASSHRSSNVAWVARARGTP